MHIHSFVDVDQVLKKYIPPARAMRGNYKLDTMRELMRMLGNPQDSYHVIHVAGTSGKTSTAYYIASQLRQTGKRVGLTVSPHVDKVSERAQIDLEPLDDEQYFREFTEFIASISKYDVNPTYFELLVAFAYWEFARQKVDYAVVEVGLGGLLDATNVVKRTDKVSVLTDIGLDHVDVLGSDISQIAVQKAGIILSGSDVFCLRQTGDVEAVFQRIAANQQARLHIGDYLGPDAKSSLPLYQQRNWYLANQVVKFLQERDGLLRLNDEQKLKSQQVRVPARMEVIQTSQGILVLDAAHNPQKMQALVPSLLAHFPNQKFAVLLALLRSKDMRLSGILDQLLPITSHLIVTDFVAGQDLRKHSTDPQQIVAACHARGFESVEIIKDTTKAYDVLMKRPERLHLVTGSFYLLHDIHKLELTK